MSKKKDDDDHEEAGPTFLPLPGLSNIEVPPTPAPDQPAPHVEDEETRSQKRKTPLEREALAHERTLLVLQQRIEFHVSEREALRAELNAERERLQREIAGLRAELNASKEREAGLRARCENLQGALTFGGWWNVAGAALLAGGSTALGIAGAMPSTYLGDVARVALLASGVVMAAIGAALMVLAYFLSWFHTSRHVSNQGPTA
jgi:hypothetical protein